MRRAEQDHAIISAAIRQWRRRLSASIEASYE